MVNYRNWSPNFFKNKILHLVIFKNRYNKQDIKFGNMVLSAHAISEFKTHMLSYRICYHFVSLRNFIQAFPKSALHFRRVWNKSLPKWDVESRIDYHALRWSYFYWLHMTFTRFDFFVCVLSFTKANNKMSHGVIQWPGMPMIHDPPLLKWDVCE